MIAGETTGHSPQSAVVEAVWQDTEITGRNSDRFLSWATEEIGEGVTSYIIDLGLVEYVNAAGLASLLRATRLAELKGGRIIWRNLNENVANLVRLAGLDRVLVVA